MTSEEWMEMIRIIPEVDQSQLVLVLQNGCEIMIDTIFRYEKHFLVVRGRQGGTIEESRAFFIPYSQMLYTRIERIVKLEELSRIFGDNVPDRVITAYGQEIIGATEPPPPPKEPTPPTVVASSEPKPPSKEDSGALSRNNLLERIRAAKATAASTVRFGTNAPK